MKEKCRNSVLCVTALGIDLRFGEDQFCKIRFPVEVMPTVVDLQVRLSIATSRMPVEALDLPAVWHP